MDDELVLGFTYEDVKFREKVVSVYECKLPVTADNRRMSTYLVRLVGRSPSAVLVRFIVLLVLM